MALSSSAIDHLLQRCLWKETSRDSPTYLKRGSPLTMTNHVSGPITVMDSVADLTIRSTCRAISDKLLRCQAKRPKKVQMEESIVSNGAYCDDYRWWYV